MFSLIPLCGGVENKYLDSSILFALRFYPKEVVYMSSTNKKRVNNLRTHEGAKATPASKIDALRRSVMSCMLWEDTFYEDGVEIAERIRTLASSVDHETVFDMADHAKNKMHLRHAPMWLLLAHANKAKAQDYLRVINRVDDIPELLSMYWKDGKKPIPKQMKIALGEALRKFDAYQLAKYNRGKDITLKDVMRLCHPKPQTAEEKAVWSMLMKNSLKAPDTWEVALSGGADKKETFTRLLEEKKLGALALLRNLRNMINSGVDENLVKESIRSIKNRRILPFQFFTAAKHAPMYEAELDVAMMKCLEERENFPGKTVLLVDVSYSMKDPITNKSTLSRMDAACALAALAREICEDCRVYTFSDGVAEVPPRSGFALRDAIVSSQLHNGTYLGRALRQFDFKKSDRLIVFTDEQSSDPVGQVICEKRYMINVATYKNGVSYNGHWRRVDGFSEAVIDWICEYEKEENRVSN